VGEGRVGSGRLRAASSSPLSPGHGSKSYFTVQFKSGSESFSGSLFKSLKKSRTTLKVDASAADLVHYLRVAHYCGMEDAKTMNILPDTKFWLYKQRYDTGFAPCIEPDPVTKQPLLTLATCKQDIRMKAKKDEVVIGISANDDGNRLSYVAVVTGVIERGGYYRIPEYKSRFDNIYDDINGKAIWNGKSKEELSDEHLKEDVGKDFEYGRVLLSDSNSFHYPGADGKRVFSDELLEYLNPLSRGALQLYPRGKLYKEVWRMVANIDIQILSPRHRHNNGGCSPRVLPLVVEITLTLTLP
jgi:hypothetical protein